MAPKTQRRSTCGVWALRISGMLFALAKLNGPPFSFVGLTARLAEGRRFPVAGAEHTQHGDTDRSGNSDANMAVQECDEYCQWALENCLDESCPIEVAMYLEEKFSLGQPVMEDVMQKLGHTQEEWLEDFVHRTSKSEAG
ncbi:unnamed protein product [Polarella glacialis]|uniref:Uncharacterized protein n=1 Tax=Polarella glacialis TaxID=89957 RepID=A0A813FPT1_POLGL|nr:unnamed protein product [Polarella glacialis]CAE8646618.1 unnamed protein product [Polarella glacialis]